MAFLLLHPGSIGTRGEETSEFSYDCFWIIVLVPMIDLMLILELIDRIIKHLSVKDSHLIMCCSIITKPERDY